MTAEPNGEFERHVQPVRDGLLSLLDASHQLRASWGSLPAADSRAMAELASESQYAGEDPWGDEPIAQAHNLAVMLLVGAEDCARSTCRLLASDAVPVYAHMVLARAALEHSGRAWWLLNPKIGTRARVARGVNERIHGLAQQDLLPLAVERRHARERRKELIAEGERLGLQRIGGRHEVTYLAERRPSPTALMRKLLGDEQDRHLGGVVYWLFSAVAHGTTSGLSQSVDADAPEVPKTPGITWGAVYTSSSGVCSVLTALLLGYSRAAKARNELFGWASDDWNHALATAMAACRNALGFDTDPRDRG